MAQRTYDVVVFGATGFTGGLAAEYLAKTAPPATRWAIAGRDQKKLWALRERLDREARPPADAIVVDVGRPETMRQLAASTRVLLTTVGPYVEHGEPALRAAVEGGADYVDITGEPSFVAGSIAAHDATAREKGLRIVHCCGFEAIPPDLGVLYTVEQLPRGVPITVEGFVRSRGTFSGGTWRSAIGAFSKIRSQTATLRGPKRETSDGRRVRSSPRRIRWVPEIEAWGVPFPTIDPTIVLRSARELELYGPDFRYGHFVRMRNLSSVGAGMVGLASVVALAQLPPTREMLLRMRKPGEGPDPETRSKSWFEITFVGEGGSHRVVTTVSGGDPGYGETAKMVAESALCLAHDRALLPARAGVLTPAVAMGDRLRERIERAGIRFQTKDRV
jgi:short subunit dehydrogenase-like uncharacterized protein